MNEIEFQKSRRWLETYCNRHNLNSSVNSYHVEVLESCLVLCNENQTSHLRFCFYEESWQVHFQSKEGEWRIFPNVSKSQKWIDISNALEAAPLHVHWASNL